MGPVFPQHRRQETGWGPSKPSGSYLLLNSRDVSGLKVASSEQIWRERSSKQEPFLGHLHQDESDQLSHVHPADHLLEPADEGKREMSLAACAVRWPQVDLKNAWQPPRPKHNLGNLFRGVYPATKPIKPCCHHHHSARRAYGYLKVTCPFAEAPPNPTHAARSRLGDGRSVGLGCGH